MRKNSTCPLKERVREKAIKIAIHRNDDGDDACGGGVLNVDSDS